MSCACGAMYDDAAWRELPVVERIEAREVRRFAHWPEGVRVEVRRCRCGQPIAAVKGS